MITIPTWIITLLVPLFVTILIAVIVNIKVAARQNGNFETCITELKARMDRIEIKFDAYILSQLENVKK